MEIATLHLTIAADLISFISGIFATIVIWYLAKQWVGEKKANLAIWAFCLFPGTLFMSLAYAEPLFLLLVGTSFYFFDKKQWDAASIFGLLASATRRDGIILAVFYGLVGIIKLFKTKDISELKAFTPAAINPLGAVIYIAYLGILNHNLFIWFQTVKKVWNQKFDFGKYSLMVISSIIKNQGSLIANLVFTIGVVTLVIPTIAFIASKAPLKYWGSGFPLMS